ncbi:helix-turn-helix domain-containing protein [Vibrio paucivorans]|uniref:Helix-turn-helix domain-containing protein n=1 Tax=Vibrio paucivorans TaxID=2829489 RepID=A0A9X3HUJ4_9VIBR|nr:helix-turn-helix domain-containing protein [Vibrio paucivorans]MCW8336716.1 helix-turn-helix domain-containing protein [Vibrio paucivorans]
MSQEPIVGVLIKRRKQAGISREKIASIAGMSEKTYQRIERGEADMRLSQYRAILRALEMTDLDVALDMMDVQQVSTEDVASASRMLNNEARQLLVKLMVMIFLDRQADKS